MNQLVAYHRPTSVTAAGELLSADGRIVLAGGTTLRHDGGAAPVEVVDLQSLGVDGIVVDSERIGIGAMATLQSIADHDGVPDIVRSAARAELPSTLRTLGTIGGTIGASDDDSLLLAALLVHDATVRFADDREVSLGDVLAQPLEAGELIVGIDIEATGRGAIARTGRTPADTPIVAAVARATGSGIRLALCGVAGHPIVVEPGEVGSVDPPADFRGSTEYRRHLAQVLADRVVGELS